MALLLDGNASSDADELCKIGNLTCSRHLFESTVAAVWSRVLRGGGIFKKYRANRFT